MVILLHGDDSFRSRQRLATLISAFAGKYDARGFGTVRFDATSGEPERLRTLLRNQGFFGSKRMVVVERVSDAPSAFQQAAVPPLVGVATVDSVVVLVWEPRAVGKSAAGRTARRAGSRPTRRASPAAARNPLAPLLEAARVEEFAPLSGPQLSRWVQEAARSRGFRLTVPALTALTQRTGHDLWAVSASLDKLNAARVGTEVDAPLVEDLVVGEIPPGIFALTDAVAERRTDAALALLERELAGGAAPIALLAMLTRQFRVLTLVATSGSATAAALAKRYGLHPYVVQKALHAVRRFPRGVVVERFWELLQLERELKSGHPNPALALERFVVRAGAKPQLRAGCRPTKQTSGG